MVELGQSGVSGNLAILFANRLKLVCIDCPQVVSQALFGTDCAPALPLSRDRNNGHYREPGNQQLKPASRYQIEKRVSHESVPEIHGCGDAAVATPAPSNDYSLCVGRTELAVKSVNKRVVL